MKTIYRFILLTHAPFVWAIAQPLMALEEGPVITVHRPTQECSACECRNCVYDAKGKVYTCECKTCFGVWHTTSIPINPLIKEINLVSIDGILADALREKDGCWHGWADGFPIKYCGEVCAINIDWQGEAFVAGNKAWFADFSWLTEINGIEHRYRNNAWEPLSKPTIAKLEEQHPALFERERDRGT